ncbi:uncharacterized protein LAJ45_03104 [Morchella importuna]|uniref:AAA-domain-containing protein n=1 Tax=Morchella conica CCBAS932 TaxID=1392247 RepID=A0A3N4KUT5_9PEZI|nr:uncharacterized protein LAJ45_03104 [Morchella importuna]KAH8152878.1 hypothetical protein LAJ45_03104 [Morchella importuna]RPB13022.1 AAA-domain-containing protein [Morchella conica CCBAS932]
MLAVTRRALLSVLPIARRRPLPNLPPRHLRSTTRCFHGTPRALQTDPNDPHKPNATPTDFFTKKTDIQTDSPPRESKGSGASPTDGEPAESTIKPETEDLLSNGGDENPADRPQRSRGRPSGSKSRGGRLIPKTIPAMPKPEVPLWFLEHGVTLREDSIVDPANWKLGISPAKEITESGKAESEEELETNEVKQLLEEIRAEKKYRYWVDDVVWKEIITHVQAGLMLPKATYLDSFASMKSNCLLHFPKEGGIYFLDAVVEAVASDVGADLVRIDAQDLEEIAGDFLGDSRHLSNSPGFSSHAIRSIGYDAQLASSLSKEVEETEEDVEETEEEEYEEEEEHEAEPVPPKGFPSQLISNLPEPLKQLLMSGRLAGATVIPISSLSVPGLGKTQETLSDHSNEKKMQALLEALITAAQKKRAAKSSLSITGTSTSETPKDIKENTKETIKTQRQSRPNKTIVHIRDYRELERTNSGDAVIRMLHDIVQRRRRDGENIIILGTTSMEETSENLTKSGLRLIQSQPEDSYERTILVPPHLYNVLSDVFRVDKEARIREVNIRHLRDVIRRRSGDTGQDVSLTLPKDWHLKKDEDDTVISGIKDTIWNFDRVHRVATTVLGQRLGKGGEIGIQEIKQAAELLDNSDAIKFAWASDERLRQKTMKEIEEMDGELDPTFTKVSGEWKSTKVKLPKNCTPHEKKLLGGVINPENIHTGFSSVRAPEETIEALKTLTSMSLIRPEAFKYGVLATDRIPGVLLYGPPGTGKTLLAKAVAKESGATVLEVSGSEIFDMYVGEGEKNVKAIFSLAKKLSPCVVFIDEADAVFGSRHSHSTRTAHREIINQFLKEWADLTTTAFIMVATNRPFDLDDAVLRRLPRRILVDLPTRDDRLEILKIHLEGEVLAPTVLLESIADQTNLFSGSDLKNICVSAALACVREENADAAKAKSAGEEYQYPEKRLLEDRHFAKALEEISASISDDMSSLTEIRKFDEKFGEKKGKKKRKANWGFGMGADQPQSEGTGRVRAD